MTAAYFEDLTAHLHARGVPADRARATVEELAAFTAESGADPADEFGPAADFAAQLAPGAAPTDPGDETWVWTADAFQDVALLNRHGDQGWEVDRIDALGRFVSHRAPDGALRWEYRRETTLPGRAPALAERLAPEGWEPCGTWITFAYFKRPKAASEGPRASLTEVPETPPTRLFWSRRFYAFAAVYLAAVAALFWLAGDRQESFYAGLATGALLATTLVLVLYLKSRRH